MANPCTVPLLTSNQIDIVNHENIYNLWHMAIPNNLGYEIRMNTDRIYPGSLEPTVLCEINIDENNYFKFKYWRFSNFTAYQQKEMVVDIRQIQRLQELFQLKLELVIYNYTIQITL